MITLQIKLNGSISSSEDPVSHIIRKSVDNAWQHFTESTLRRYYDNPEWKAGTYEMIESIFNKRHIALKHEIIDATIMHISELISINPSAAQSAQFNPLLYQEEPAKESEIKTDGLSPKATALLNWLRDYWPEKNVSQSIIMQTIRGCRSLANCKLATKELEEAGILKRNLKSIKVKGRMTRITWKINLPNTIKVPPLPKKQTPVTLEAVDPVTQAWLDAKSDDYLVADSENLHVIKPKIEADAEEEKPTIFRKIFPSFFTPKPHEPDVTPLPYNIEPKAAPESANIDEIVKKIYDQKRLKKSARSKALVRKMQVEGLDIIPLYQKYKALYPSYGKITIAEIIHEIDKPVGLKGAKLSINSIYMMLKSSIKDGKIDL